MLAPHPIVLPARV